MIFWQIGYMPSRYNEYHGISHEYQIGYAPSICNLYAIYMSSNIYIHMAFTKKKVVPWSKEGKVRQGVLKTPLWVVQSATGALFVSVGCPNFVGHVIAYIYPIVS